MRREWWKEELICLFKGEEAWEEPAFEAEEKTVEREEAKEKDRTGAVECCPYCGKETADYLDQHFLKGKMCDACYRTGICKQAEAAEVVEQCFKNLYAMYGISQWGDLRVGILPVKSTKTHQFPWDNRDVKYENKKRHSNKDQLFIVNKLPRNMAETAVVKKLLEKYMEIRFPDNPDRKEGEVNKKYTGLVLWCVLHYLFLVQGKEYAERYEEALSGEDAKSYGQCRELLGTPMNGTHIGIQELVRRLNALRVVSFP